MLITFRILYVLIFCSELSIIVAFHNKKGGEKMEYRFVTLWEMIKEREELSKRISNWESCNLLGYEKMNLFFLDKGWLNEAISQQTLKLITPENPMFICAPTGSGKTTMIFDDCLPIALSEGKKVLFLSPRSILVEQIKKHAIKHELNKKQKSGEITVEEIPLFYKEEYIKKLSDFGLLDITTYQSFYYEANRYNPLDYSFVIFDEAHFFISDACFNRHTERIHQMLVNMFAGNRRIYLSATPEECIEKIYELEIQKNCKDITTTTQKALDVYTMSEDYTYVSAVLFNTYDEIVNTINEYSENESWLIFVRTKETAGNIISKLNDKENTYFFTADTEKDDVFLKELITNERLPKRIVCSTKVLDVGVNIRTQNLNIVVFEDNIVEAKQMLGRKRIIKGEKIKVYFQMLSAKDIAKRLQLTRQDLSKYNDAVKQVVYGGKLDSIDAPLFIENGVLKINRYYKEKLLWDKHHYEKLKSLVSVDDWRIYFETQFPGINTDHEGLVLKQLDLQIDEIVKPYLEETIDKPKMQALVQSVLNIIGDHRTNKQSLPGKKCGNDSLKPFGYEIASGGNPTRYQIIRIGVKEDDV